jgi:aspartate/methionine/tyrosine aminotransferase
VKLGELRELVRLAANGVPSGRRERPLALISDEVFSDYELSADSDRAATLAGVEDCLAFSMSGLSKVAGLPQMKLGWIVAAGPETLRREALERLEWIADTYLSVSTPVQCAAAALLDAGESVQRQIRERTAANLALARELLEGSAASILQVEGGWYITLQVPRVRSEEEWVAELLEKEDVLVQPGFFYDFESEAYLVVSLLTEPEAFREGLGRLRRWL